jgi:hypothetical protein
MQNLLLLFKGESLFGFPKLYEFLKHPVQSDDLNNEWVDRFFWDILLNQVFSDDGFKDFPDHLVHPLIKIFDFK